MNEQDFKAEFHRIKRMLNAEKDPHKRWDIICDKSSEKWLCDRLCEWCETYGGGFDNSHVDMHKVTMAIEGVAKVEDDDDWDDLKRDAHRQFDEADTQGEVMIDTEETLG